MRNDSLIFISPSDFAHIFRARVFGTRLPSNCQLTFVYTKQNGTIGILKIKTNPVQVA